jgi:N-formylmaleamate deformylase
VRAEWLHTCDETAVAQTHQGFQTDDIHADLAAVQHRAAFIAAGKGPLSAEALNEIRRIAPLMPVRVVPNTGHMIPIEDLEGFLEAFDELTPIARIVI